MMQEVRLEPVEGSEWDDITPEFHDICQEQVYAYATARWSGVSIEPVLFYDAEVLIGGALVMVQKLPLGLGQMAIIKWAPMFAQRRSQAEQQRLYLGIIGALQQEYARKRKMMLSIMPSAEITDINYAEVALKEMGFRAGEGLNYPNRYIVDLRVDEPTRLAAVAQKWRYNLRKSLKEELLFEHADLERFPEFAKLYDDMVKRKNFTDYSAYDTVESLLELKEGQARPQLFFVRKNAQLIAGALIFSCGDTAAYLYGATHDDALRYKAGYFLQWNVIAWLQKNTKARFYDLGGSDGDQGLDQFKTGLIGKAGFITPVPPFYNYALSTKALLMGNLAFGARRVVRQLRDAAFDTKTKLTDFLTGNWK